MLYKLKCSVAPVRAGLTRKTPYMYQRLRLTPPPALIVLCISRCRVELEVALDNLLDGLQKVLQ